VLKCIVGLWGHLLFFGLLFFGIVPGAILHLILKPLVGRYYVFQKGSAFCYRVFFILAPRMVLKLHFDKNDVPKGAVFVSTHQSILDFPALITFIPNFLIFANVDLSKFPLIAKISHVAGVRYIKGRSLDEVAQIHKEMQEHLEKGGNVIYFAEGTRHTECKLLPFKRGAFRLAKKTGKMVVPIVIEGAYNFLPRKAFCIKTLKKGFIHVNMLKPLNPKDFKNEKELKEFAYEVMQKEKERLCDM
jgi:1-acyl-sn-glycerol-3-phosphate acyltransferase